MDPDASRRYATAADLADDLERLLNLQPIKAKPATLATRAWKAARRNRAAVFGAILGVVVAMTLAVATGIYLWVAPGRAAQSVRQARLALLDPYQSDRLAATLYQSDQDGQRVLDDLAGRTVRAMRHYQSALRWNPLNSSVRLERDVVRLAERLAHPHSHGRPEHGGVPVRGSELQGRAPLAAQYAARWAPDRLRASDSSNFDAASADDLRSLGLLAFLLGDSATAIDAWTRFEVLAKADPFVQASLGQLYLLSDDPQAAMPHLREAYHGLPGVGFLCADYADAAVQVGELNLAARLIEQARRLERHEPYPVLDRVEADYWAAIGEDDKARQRYESFRSRQFPSARYRYVKFLWARGEWETARVVAHELVRLRPKMPLFRAAFVEAADRWWASLDGVRRFQRVRRALDEYPQSPASLVAVLRTYLECKALQSEPGAPATGQTKSQPDPGSEATERRSGTSARPGRSDEGSSRRDG
jgi:hypothetical protein